MNKAIPTKYCENTRKHNHFTNHMQMVPLIALSLCGHVYTFGNGDHLTLGYGTRKKLSVPQLVEKLKNHKIIKVARYHNYTATIVEPIHE